MKQKYVYIYHGLFLLSLLLLGADTIRANTTVQKYMFFNAMSWTMAIAVILTVLRTRYQIQLTGIVRKFNAYILAPAVLGTAIVLSLIDYITPLNTVFYTTQIQYTVLYFTGLYLLYITMANCSNKAIMQYYKPILSTGTISGLLISLTPWIWPFDAFAYITREDSIVENLQAVAVLISAYFAFRAGKILLKKKVLSHAYIFFAAAVILFLVAGDELTWGQRHIKYASPDYFLENNSQNEPSIHNMNAVDDFVSIGYIVIGFYGSVAWIIQNNIKRFQAFPLYLYVPPWYAANYFLLSMAFNLYTRDRLHFIGEWGEPVELLLYVGVLITIIRAHYLARHHKTSPRYALVI